MNYVNMKDVKLVATKRKSKTREYIESFAVAALVALTVRAFVIEAFKIPSGSMIPTLSIGDHIFVNKFIYGLRIPFTKIRFLDISDPKRGDIAVFIYPVDESKDFIKRVVGMPGDRIHIDGENVTINGNPVPKTILAVAKDPADKRRLLVTNGMTHTIPFIRGWDELNVYEEKLGEANHLVQYEENLERESYDIVVPPNQFFVMGDNRDNSADSREWGFVPRENIKGKAMFVWLSLDHDQGGLRWREFGRWVR
ncbi:MAG: signal peptidase I [Deltaproteobacteria bacterium]|nr:signal peptidase I [Deltaproteobacteria bacterium]